MVVEEVVVELDVEEESVTTVVDGTGSVVVVVDSATAGGAVGGVEHSGGRCSGVPVGLIGVGPAPMQPKRDRVMCRVIFVPSAKFAVDVDSRM